MRSMMVSWRTPRSRDLDWVRNRNGWTVPLVWKHQNGQLDNYKYNTEQPPRRCKLGRPSSGDPHLTHEQAASQHNPGCISAISQVAVRFRRWLGKPDCLSLCEGSKLCISKRGYHPRGIMVLATRAGRVMEYNKACIFHSTVERRPFRAARDTISRSCHARVSARLVVELTYRESVLTIQANGMQHYYLAKILLAAYDPRLLRLGFDARKVRNESEV